VQEANVITKGEKRRKYERDKWHCSVCDMGW